ncbi:beta-lactamase/transpeptidase-like protein [Lophiotrema nucula]|uniref:Beta-lactamase/transpeptidase-like protein n=1 Tax=Lophiotrema nucula TaxID=690887 RepID=A0A6A5YQV5_9PLEO|nr:beta-lactamase/transpeptidase-like protein [Lophiotrema nucula]
MRIQYLASGSIFLHLTNAFCPVYGPSFPAPTSLSQSSVIKSAFSDLTAALNKAFETGNSSHGPNDKVSANAIQVFSIDEDAPLYEFYREGSLLSSPGTKKIDGDSIWRVGSISKLITVYMTLAELGDGVWDTKITDAIPELKGNEKWKEDPVRHVNWDEVTLGALAGHLAGVAQSLTVQLGSLYQNPTPYGFPVLDSTELPPCILPGCDRKAFFEALDLRQPIFLPNTSPVYSSVGIVLLAFALENLSGKTYQDMLQSVLIDRLGLTGTSYSKPADDSRGVIPYNLSSSLWTYDLSELTPAGGLYSSLNDLAKFGRSILRSTILDENTTRGWLKPITFNGNLYSATGRTWEIYRVADAVPDQVIDFYSKGGDITPYKTFIAVVPDLKMGFAAAVAGTGSHRWMDGLLIDAVFPAVQEAARQQAHAAYGGTYKATNGLNSSLTLASEAGKSGLLISEWISNGTDFISITEATQGSSRDVRLFPTNVERKSGDGKEVAWRVAPDLLEFKDDLPFSACRTWFGIDSQTYGNHAVDEMIFQLDGNGKAVKVSLPAFKVGLERQ